MCINELKERMAHLEDELKKTRDNATVPGHRGARTNPPPPEKGANQRGPLQTLQTKNRPKTAGKQVCVLMSHVGKKGGAGPRKEKI